MQHDPTFDFKAAYIKLINKVKDMRAAQKHYFSSGRNYTALANAKAKEKEVDEIINPQPPRQATIDWLAQ